MTASTFSVPFHRESVFKLFLIYANIDFLSFFLLVLLVVNILVHTFVGPYKVLSIRKTPIESC